MPQGTVFYHFYRGISALAAPLIWKRVSAKLEKQGVEEARRRERLGEPTEGRPEGPLLWFHGASVGESLSVLTLAERMQALVPGAQVLITSGTASSAAILEERMPEGFLHQFAPLDQAPALQKFFAHWRPDAGIFVESEIWPQMLVQARAAGVPLALVNARMSQGTMRNWKRFDHTARFLLSQFEVIRTQDRATLEGLVDIGAPASQAALGPNLKAVSAPLPVDPTRLARMQEVMPGPLWLAASTHEGEEKQVLKAHARARKTIPDLGLIIAPRHPERADAIAAEVEKAGYPCARRSLGDIPSASDVYLADTLGEMGLWYALAPVVFLGGSLGSAGGHNPYEPARQGCAIVTGPKVANFADVYAEFDLHGAVRRLKRPRDLGRAITALLTETDAAQTLGDAARAFVADQEGALDDLAGLLVDRLMPDAPRADAPQEGPEAADSASSGPDAAD
ncbi:3-deoxy-D-manno-octulosonic acid transferase [Pseudooceanicola sp. C21-150M6]|uniref:3-deoxy-D-manno-octulosonic acid transferase n=1 Tax=Pseudooceanicola sp. C21-150M6 TaxID=3434355 RepID=UPI003D7F6F11